MRRYSGDPSMCIDSVNGCDMLQVPQGRLPKGDGVKCRFMASVTLSLVPGGRMATLLNPIPSTLVPAGNVREAPHAQVRFISS